MARANVCEARWISRGRQCQSAEGGFVGVVASSLGKVGFFKRLLSLWNWNWNWNLGGTT